MPSSLFPVLGSKRQEEIKFKASLSYTVSVMPTWTKKYDFLPKSIKSPHFEFSLLKYPLPRTRLLTCLKRVESYESYWLIATSHSLVLPLPLL